MPRKRRSKTEYDKARDNYREASPRHVVTFEADMDEDMKRHAFAYANDLRMLGNNAVGILNKRIDQLFRTKEYRALQKDYGWHVRHMDGLAVVSTLGRRNPLLPIFLAQKRAHNLKIILYKDFSSCHASRTGL